MRLRFKESITVALDGVGYKTQQLEAGAILEDAPAELAADLIRGDVAELVGEDDEPLTDQTVPGSKVVGPSETKVLTPQEQKKAAKAAAKAAAQALKDAEE